MNKIVAEFQGAIKKNDFSEKPADRRFELPACGISSSSSSSKTSSDEFYSNKNCSHWVTIKIEIIK